MSEKATRNRGLGHASSRLIAALADEAPKLVTREELLESESLRVAHQKPDKENLDEHEVAAAAKALGRIVAKGHGSPIREVLILDRKSNDVPTKEVGLIGVSISLTELRPDRRSKGAPKSQEEILSRIVEDSHAWVAEQSGGGFPDVHVAGAYIIHGSSEYDIIIFANYLDTEIYMKYVRDVIQKIPGVEKTHTMQVAHGLESSPMF